MPIVITMIIIFIIIIIIIIINVMKVSIYTYIYIYIYMYISPIRNFFKQNAENRFFALLLRLLINKPKYRWEDNIKRDICQMKIKNRIACVQDRGKWKEEVVEKAKTISN